MPKPTDEQIADELEAMVREYQGYRENIEHHAIRLGLSVTATRTAVAECELRLAVLTELRSAFADLLSNRVI